MKHFQKILLGSLLLCGLLLGWSGCVTDGYVAQGVYYGPQREPWFRDDSWMDGTRGYRQSTELHHGTPVDLYISPPRRQSAPREAAPARPPVAPQHPVPQQRPAPSKDDRHRPDEKQ